MDWVNTSQLGSILDSIILYVFVSHSFTCECRLGENDEKFFSWEGNNGGKINNLVLWNLSSKSRCDGGYGIGVLKHRNTALIAKWGAFFWLAYSWKEFLVFEVLEIIFPKFRSVWSIFAHFNLGNGKMIFFWHDPWLRDSPLKMCFPWLFAVSSSPNGSISDYWDSSHLSWNITFQRLLKDAENDNFQSLLEWTIKIRTWSSIRFAFMKNVNCIPHQQQSRKYQ